MRRLFAWVLIASVSSASCALVGGYDFDGYYVDGDAGPPTDGPTVDAADADASSEAEAATCVAVPNLKSDARNCGACGHDCLRGVCAGGSCQPWTIASGETANPCDGGGCGPYSLAVMPGALFWAFFAPSGGIYRGDLADGGVRMLAAQASPYVVATDSTFVYWSDGTSIFRCPVQSCGGSAPAPYEPGSYVFVNQMTFAGSSIFWTQGRSNNADAGHIWSSDDGVAPTPTAIANSQRNPQGIAIDGATVYWVDQGTPPLLADGSVMAANLDGTNIRPIIGAQKAPQRIGVLGGRIFWVNAGTPPKYIDGSVMTCDPLACAPTPIAVDQGYPYEMAVDPSGVYWTTTAAGPDGGGATLPIMGCSPPAPGCKPTPIATASYPWAIATDDKAVYWTDLSLGLVMGLAK